MADERTLARRYARALLDVAKEREAAAPGEIDALEQDLHGVAALWRGSRELRALVAHPRVTREEKRRALGAALAGKVRPLTLDFLGLLLAKKRLSLIEVVAEEYDEASDEAQDVAKAKVTTYLPLTEAQRRALLEKLRAFTARKNIVLEEAQDKALLGGIVVRIGDQVLDGSVAGSLRKLRERLLLREEERAQQAAAAAMEALRG